MDAEAWARSCLRKTGFKRREYAEKVAAKIKDKKMRVYYCYHCTYYHLSSKEKLSKDS